MVLRFGNPALRSVNLPPPDDDAATRSYMDSVWKRGISPSCKRAALSSVRPSLRWRGTSLRKGGGNGTDTHRPGTLSRRPRPPFNWRVS